ncbi:MAG: DUF3857 domain-containing protein [Marinilabiliales bacterium]|nr:DUF3857 domain-containing protein [Marinilabiliales bacterium]
MKNCLFFACLMIGTIQLAVGQKFKIDKTPDWVKEVIIPDKNLFEKSDISQGYYLLLSDQQVNLEKNEHYNREVRDIVSYSGITQASQVIVSYDTTYQQLKVHHLYVVRNGEKIDRTKGISFKNLNNEYNLNQGIYMGLTTAYANLEDIRKDDLIDFSYTIVGVNPIFGKEKYFLTTLEANNPIDRIGLRVLYPKDLSYDYKCFNCDSSVHLNDQIIGNYHEITIVENHVKAFTMEDNVPGWFMPFKYFTITSMKSWKDVNKWAQEVFALSKEPNFDGLYKELFTGKENTEEKIDKIIHFVQNEIRYMGIEVGIGSIKPFPPEQVIKQRFGDCKDKSLLLVSLLKRNGVESAYPALVNTIMQSHTGTLSPSNKIFDHCIVKFVYKGKTYWVDPTIAHQGGDFKKMASVDYGQALVIGEPSDTLASMNIEGQHSVIEIKDEFNISSFTEPAKYDIVSKRIGLEADQRRIMLEQNSNEDWAKYVTDDLKKSLPGAKLLGKVEMSDDVVENVSTVRYHYAVDDLFQNGDKQSDKRFTGFWFFKFEPQTLYQELNSNTCEERKMDYALSYPLNITYEVLFNLPKEMMIFDLYNQYDNEAFFFDEKIVQVSPKSFRVIYHYRTKAPSLKAASFKKICEEKNNISKKLPILIYFSK